MAALDRLSRKTSTGRYIAEVDGIRFVAIMMVLVFHATLTAGVNQIKPFGGMRGFDQAGWGLWQRVASDGRFGVHLFFILSGFILGLPFVTGAPRIGSYFKRRLTRLEPPYLLALTLCFLLAPAGMVWHYVSGLGYQHYAAFGAANPLNGAYWSLEVEIQFYLVLPLLAQVYKVRMKRAILGLGILATLPLVSVTQALVLPRFLCYFLMGMLLAELYVAHPIKIRVLAYKPIAIMGGMAYSIYLLHYPLMVLLARWLPHNPAIAALVLVPASLLAGLAFFVLVERPCMEPDWPARLRTRLRRKVGDDEVRGELVLGGEPARL